MPSALAENLNDESHDVLSREACDVILDYWRSGNSAWKNNFICDEIHYCAGTQHFPSPDRSFYSPTKKTRVAIEFKPWRESKRGCLTGLGQAIAYLNNDNNSASYLVIPDMSADGFEIGTFLEGIFKKKINGKLPVGLITFDPRNVRDVMLRCNLADSLDIAEIRHRGVDDSYWAAFRDWPPMAYYNLLSIADQLPTDDDRSKKIWDSYWNTIYLSDERIPQTLELIPNKIRMFDGTYHIPMSVIKNRLSKKVEEKQITQSQAIEEIKRQTSDCETDNLYQDYKKNHRNFMNHCKLWDPDTNHILSNGKVFKERIDHGADPNEEMAQILVAGKHIELIHDFKKITDDMLPFPDSDAEYRKHLEQKLSEKGFIKKNPERASSGVRRLFSAELQLWFKLGLSIKTQSAKHFHEGKGFVFNEERIKQLEGDFLKNYGSLDKDET
jgi:hypothetical protein